VNAVGTNSVNDARDEANQHRGGDGTHSDSTELDDESEDDRTMFTRSNQQAHLHRLPSHITGTTGKSNASNGNQSVQSSAPIPKTKGARSAISIPISLATASAVTVSTAVSIERNITSAKRMRMEVVDDDDDGDDDLTQGDNDTVRLSSILSDSPKKPRVVSKPLSTYSTNSTQRSVLFHFVSIPQLSHANLLFSVSCTRVLFRF
jgi:hypothetical protein